MDDLLTGTETFQQALELKSQLTKMFKQGWIVAAEWASNNADLVIDSQVREIILNSETSKMLGMHWHCAEDKLFYAMNLNDCIAAAKQNSTKFTKQINSSATI